MTILNNCELWFVKCDPKRPCATFNTENPTWELQIRTTSKEQKKEWEALDLPVKAIVPDEGAPYFRVNLRKKSLDKKGEPAQPVEVMNGKREPLDPNTVGNGSIANVRIFQYEYPKKTGGGVGIASMVTGFQVTKHIVFHARPREEFGDAETETIEPPVELMDDDDGSEPF
jgi:hypothetical protein